MSENVLSSLYEKMKNNPDLAGRFRLVSDELIEWDLFEGYHVTIWEDYIGIIRFPRAWYRSDLLIHWHPANEELYDEICRLGTKGNVTVVHKSWIGMSIPYSGPAKDCPVGRKWLFGKYLYLYHKPDGETQGKESNAEKTPNEDSVSEVSYGFCLSRSAYAG